MSERTPEEQERADFDRLDSMKMALLYLSDPAYRQEIAGDWPLAKVECDYNPDTSCADVMKRGNGHCCREYDQHDPA